MSSIPVWLGLIILIAFDNTGLVPYSFILTGVTTCITYIEYYKYFVQATFQSKANVYTNTNSCMFVINSST